MGLEGGEALSGVGVGRGGRVADTQRTLTIISIITSIISRVTKEHSGRMQLFSLLMYRLIVVLYFLPIGLFILLIYIF